MPISSYSLFFLWWLGDVLKPEGFIFSYQPQWSQSSVHPGLYLHWWTCYHCHLGQRLHHCHPRWLHSTPTLWLWLGDWEDCTTVLWATINHLWCRKHWLWEVGFSIKRTVTVSAMFSSCLGLLRTWCLSKEIVPVFYWPGLLTLHWEIPLATPSHTLEW